MSRLGTIEKHPVMGLPLTSVMRPQIALILQQLMQIHTVGSFLTAWRDPKAQRGIEQVFDSPQQARHAAAVCATWLGVQVRPVHAATAAWWSCDEQPQLDA
jgi:hypothetical protein